MNKYIFPTILIALQIGAALERVASRDFKMFGYWACAALLNIFVTI